jgi:geranylgeranyl diphosphate synthase, type II
MLDMTASRLDQYLAVKKIQVERTLDRIVPALDEEPRRLHESMRYSLMAGGKRLRPILAIATYELCGKPDERILPPACGLELIHTYSLIHDDLPCMDDDDLRRGRPTNHKVFGEAMAVLAGDALLTLAFECFLGRGVETPSERELLAMAQIGKRAAFAAGSIGLVGGQVMDIEQYARDRQLSSLENTCHKKTGYLIEASLELGALFAGAESRVTESLKNYGRKIGLAFQVADDILNVTGDAEKLGKAVKSDAKLEKVTFPELLGLDKAKTYARNLIVEAKSDIAFFGNSAWVLQELADFIVEREF